MRHVPQCPIDGDANAKRDRNPLFVVYRCDCDAMHSNHAICCGPVVPGWVLSLGIAYQHS